MAEIIIDDETFYSSERESSAIETNFIKSNHGVYYNSMEGAVHIIDSLADSLTDELAVVLFITRDSIVMAFANNPETNKATTIQFNLNKDNKAKDLNRLRLSLLRYCMIYSHDNSFKVVQIGRVNRTVNQLLEKTNLKYKIIDEAHLKHTLGTLLKSFSVAEKIKRIAISIGIASLSLVFGAYLNMEIDLYFKKIDKEVRNNTKKVTTHKKQIRLSEVKYLQIKESYDALTYTEYRENSSDILSDFEKNFGNGNLFIKDFKVVDFVPEPIDKKGGKK